jgi:hypothetical protein
VAPARQRERIALNRSESADAALHNRLNLLESVPFAEWNQPFTAPTGRFVPPGGTKG